MSFNLAQFIEGPAEIKYKGQTFLSARTLGAAFMQDDFAIETSAYGPIDRRAKQPTARITLMPVGEFTDALAAILYPWTNPKFGQLVTPVTAWASANVNTGASTITVTGHGLRPGTPVSVGSFGTLPGSLALGTIYYVGVNDANTISFYTTLNAALALTGPVALTTAGTGNSQIVEQEPLTITTMMGNTITFPVAAVVGMPDLVFSAIGTLYGSLTFECFRQNGVEWSASGSFFTIGTGSWSNLGANKAIIPTNEYVLSWGSAAPFSSFQCRGPVTARFNLGLAPFETDQLGVLSRKITGLTATISGQPAGMNEDQLSKYLDMQGAGAGRGVERTINDFVIAAVNNSVNARFYGAALRNAPQQFDATNPRAGSFEWETSRNFYGSGGIHPVFAISAEAPSS